MQSALPTTISYTANKKLQTKQKELQDMNIKYFLLGIVLTLLLITGTIGEIGEEPGTAIQGNQTIQSNKTQTMGEIGEEEITLEQLMENRDWSKIAEIMNKDAQGAAPISIESSIKPAASNEKWDNWFAPKEEEGFIVVPCGG
jgi:hypothetical protein